MGPDDGTGIVVVGVLGIVVTGVIGFAGAIGAGEILGVVTGVVTGRGVGVAGVDNDDFEVPNKLAARIYCAKAAFCSGVAVLFATACRIALNSGLVAAISVKALTVSAFALVVGCAGGGIGAGAGGFGWGAGLAALAAFSAFSAFSSTFRTDRKRVSGKIWGPMTTGQIPRRVVMY